MICDICKNSCKNIYFDGATKMGPWANMCSNCFKQYGIGLGTGRGQEYHKEDLWEQDGDLAENLLRVSNAKWIKKAG